MKGNRSITRGYIIVIIVYACLIPLAIALLGTRLNGYLGLGAILPSPYNTIAGLMSLAYGWFWISWSQVNLVRRGDGHPNEILGRELGPLTRRLVTDGPYRYTRNPMAYGLIIFYFLALAFLCNAVLIIVFFPFACLFEVWYHRKYEEPGLLNRFGEKYKHYKEEVPLLFPFMRNWK